MYILPWLNSKNRRDGSSLSLQVCQKCRPRLQHTQTNAHSLRQSLGWEGTGETRRHGGVYSSAGYIQLNNLLFGSANQGKISG